MKKFLILIFFLQTSAFSQNLDNAYFAGGCFWCMEEAFEKKEGVLEVISGYSGGTTENPNYEEVTYGNSGHFEVIKVVFDRNKQTAQSTTESLFQSKNTTILSEGFDINDRGNKIIFYGKALIVLK